MSSHEFAVYEQVRPMGWIGERPADHRRIHEVGSPVPESWRDMIVDRKLSCGVKVRMERCGFVEYDVQGWAPGLSLQATGRMAEVSKAKLPALVQRLRLVNAHLALLHCAEAVHDQRVSLPVRRVRASDLYSWEGSDDEPPEFGWVGQIGPRPDVVTSAERDRPADSLTVATVEASLDLLDIVVANGALFDFDQLNLGLDALGTHDFNMALGAFWHICESRLHKLADAHGLLPPRQKKDGSKRPYFISEVVEFLEKAGVVSSAQKAELDDVREGRNALLHANTEAPQEMTERCLTRAVELLAGVAPGLKARKPRDFLWVVL